MNTPLTRPLTRLHRHLTELAQQRARIVHELYAHTAKVPTGADETAPIGASLAELHSDQVEALLALLSLGGKGRASGGTLGGWSRPALVGMPPSLLQRPDDINSEASYFTSRWLPADL